MHGLPGSHVTRHYVDILNASESGIAEAFTPGAYLVEFFPWLQYIPAWMPGTHWQQKLVGWRTQAAAICEDPYQAAKEAIVSTAWSTELCMTGIVDHRRPLVARRVVHRSRQ